MQNYVVTCSRYQFQLEIMVGTGLLFSLPVLMDQCQATQSLGLPTELTKKELIAYGYQCTVQHSQVYNICSTTNVYLCMYHHLHDALDISTTCNQVYKFIAKGMKE